MRELPPYAGLQQALHDERSGRVVLLSHCLLNQNTRYLGGAVCPGVVTAAVEPHVDAGTGIVQLPCPEQRVWGGVLKTRLLWLLDHRRAARLGPPLAAVVSRYVKRRYAHLAKAVADDVEDYVRSGLRVTSVVGVAGSPTCGAGTTIDLPAALARLAAGAGTPLTRDRLNDDVIAPSTCPGDGWFVAALRRELGRRQLAVPVTEQVLSAERRPVRSAGSDRQPGARHRDRVGDD